MYSVKKTKEKHTHAYVRWQIPKQRHRKSHTRAFTVEGQTRLPFAFSGGQSTLAVQLILCYHGPSAQLTHLGLPTKRIWRFPVCPRHRQAWESRNLSLRVIRCRFTAPDRRGLAGNTHESSLPKQTFISEENCLSSLATWAFRNKTVFQKTFHNKCLMRVHTHLTTDPTILHKRAQS